MENVLIAEFLTDVIMMGCIQSGNTMMVVTYYEDIPILAGDCCNTQKWFDWSL